MAATTTANDFLSEVTTLQKQKRRRRDCIIGSEVLPAMDAKDRDGLVNALADPVFEHVVILNALRARGYQMSVATVARHRKGECGCNV